MSEIKAKAQFDTDREVSSRTSVTTIPVTAEHDPEFYFDDSLVVIQVESTLFRVHKYHLMQSETFSDMFGMPQGSTNGLEEGASPERPIVLSRVKASDFRALLKVLYPVHFTNKKPKFESDVIVPAFRLSHMWNFADLRAHLLPLVKDALGCIDKIVLARELGVQEWLVPAHLELCQREESLTKDEGMKLGMDSTIMITRLREQFHPPKSVPGSGYSGYVWNYCYTCGGNSPIYCSHGVAANCQRCGTHMNTNTTYYRFPPTPSGTAPDSECVGSYCSSCGGSSPTYASHGAAICHKCGTSTSGTTYYRFAAMTSSTAPRTSKVELEDQVKKWVAAGCVTE